MSVEPSGRAPEIGFATRDVHPPGPLYLGANDNLLITAWNSVAGMTLTVRGRILQPGGGITPFEQTITPTADRVATSAVILQGESFLLALTISAGAASKRGQCFVQAAVSYGDQAVPPIFGVLAQDYVHSGHQLTWPGGRVFSSTEGPGVLRRVTGADPAAGAELSVTVPTGARWRVLSLEATLVTGAAVANRRVQWVLDDGATEYFRIVVGSDQTASQTVRYTLTMYHSGHTVRILVMVEPLLIVGLIPAGHRLRTVTNLIAAADDWGAPELLVEEWIEP